MSFLTEPEPLRGVPLPVRPGVKRIVAENAGVMTYHGTNTYLIECEGGVLVLDPGPDSTEHIEAVLLATSGHISKILLTHTHSDHFGACAALKSHTGAPIFAFHKNTEPGFSPDYPLADGEEVEGMVALHTPGHAADHLCFARSDGIVFTGDHVMSWCSSVVSPPRGNMAAYCKSLQIMIDRNDSLYLPGHGPPLPDPGPFVEKLLAHRVAREEAIAGALVGRPMRPEELAVALYAKKDPRLHRAAVMNVIAHLQKLAADGRVRQDSEFWLAVIP